MTIKPKEILFGQPVLKIRAVIRYFMRDHLIFFYKHKIIEKISRILNQPFSVAAKVLKSMIQHDLLLLKFNKGGNFIFWEVCLTTRGSCFGEAKATGPITRIKADQLLKELLERVTAINRNHELAYKVKSIKVFGSYLSDKVILEDLDIAFKLVPNLDENMFVLKSTKRIKLALEDGKKFRCYFDDIWWPYYEVVNLLKTKKTGLSLHNEDCDLVLEKTTHVTVYMK